LKIADLERTLKEKETQYSSTLKELETSKAKVEQDLELQLVRKNSFPTIEITPDPASPVLTSPRPSPSVISFHIGTQKKYQYCCNLNFANSIKAIQGTNAIFGTSHLNANTI
jgi:hypothetical protein